MMKVMIKAIVVAMILSACLSSTGYAANRGNSAVRRSPAVTPARSATAFPDARVRIPTPPKNGTAYKLLKK